MNKIILPATFDTPDLPPNHILNVVLGSALKPKTTPSLAPNENLGPFWNEAHFGLDRVSFFKNSREEDQKRILQIASNQVLEEAYFIEKSGMSFTAKMTLLSETTQEKMIYSIFSSDEATHLHYILSILDQAPSAESSGPFISLLSDMIREGDRESLVFLIQVVLEGWGLLHYRSLAENCLNQDLAQKLRLILKDEARHHGSGMVMSKAKAPNKKQKVYIVETLISFLKLVQCGPQNLVHAMEMVLGHFSLAQRETIFKELNCEKLSLSKIETIRSLISQGGGEDLISPLEKAGVMKPLTSKECA